MNGIPAPRIGAPLDHPQPSTSCSSTNGFEPSSGAQFKEPPTSTSSTSLEIGQSDVVPQYLHPERLPRSDTRYRGKRQAEDQEKSNMDFLSKFSEASLVEPEIAPNTALVNGVWQSDGSRHTLDRQLTRPGILVSR